VHQAELVERAPETHFSESDDETEVRAGGEIYTAEDSTRQAIVVKADSAGSLTSIQDTVDEMQGVNVRVPITPGFAWWGLLNSRGDPSVSRLSALALATSQPATLTSRSTSTVRSSASTSSCGTANRNWPSSAACGSSSSRRSMGSLKRSSGSRVSRNRNENIAMSLYWSHCREVFEVAFLRDLVSVGLSAVESTTRSPSGALLSVCKSISRTKNSSSSSSPLRLSLLLLSAPLVSPPPPAKSQWCSWIFSRP
jgi:hypothetical protein